MHCRLFPLGTAAASLLAGLALSGCSILAGYEDLHVEPDAGTAGDGAAGSRDLRTATIYSVYPAIFSPTGDLPGVTAQLNRIHALGFSVLSLMPVTPVGQAIGNHPSFDSPYCVHDYYGIEAAYGSSQDLKTLVQEAHRLGMSVLLDEEINQTAWDNALLEQHPEYYVHTDGNPANAATIATAFGFADVAQLNYQTTQYGLQSYMTSMLEYWIANYDVDGFRFLTADVPQGNPTIPHAFWTQLRSSLEATKPQIVMWADEEDPALAGAPFDLDYGWILRGGLPGGGADGGAGLQQVANGADARELEQQWQVQSTGFTGVQHVSFLQTWDFGEDIKVYGGAPSTMAAAVFDFTMDGVPMLWNGEEVGNDRSGADTHAAIDWSPPEGATFTALYTSLLSLRNASPALQSGSVTWLANSDEAHVATYTRSDATSTFLVAINFSAGAVSDSVSSPAASGWLDVSPAGSPGGTVHAPPPALSLLPYDFAVFRAKD